jgi:hypothetical protein
MGVQTSSNVKNSLLPAGLSFSHKIQILPMQKKIEKYFPNFF